MSAFVFSTRAKEDLAEIWRYLAANAGEELADCIQRELLERCEILAPMPHQGYLRPDLSRRRLRYVPVYSLLIVYRVAEPLEIVAVIHGRRDVRRALRTP